MDEPAGWPGPAGVWGEPTEAGTEPAGAGAVLTTTPIPRTTA